MKSRRAAVSASHPRSRAATRRRSLRQRCIAFLPALWLSPAVLLADTLLLTNSSTHEGDFKSYKNGRFYFKDAEGKEVQEAKARVASLRVEPPAIVSVKPQGRKKRDDLRLKGYARGSFVFDQTGREITMSAGSLSFIDMGMDFRHPEMEIVSTVVKADESSLEVEKLVATGVVTIIHFHMPGVLSSLRQGKYVESLADGSKGKVQVVRIEIPRLPSPSADKYGVTSVPQFWFYNRKGQLVRKLTERFTDEDLDAAVKEARR
jgi:hypothetical protein